jgi:RimJ/RimL family protein N-acetyltransferase
LEQDGNAVLCGSVGFKGAPDVAGMVEIGYAVIRSYQGRGIATEMVQALSNWAFRQPGILEIQAEVLPQNLPSLRVLAKAGFVQINKGSENGMLRFRFSAQDRTPERSSFGTS